jgi:hypothetical protein
MSLVKLGSGVESYLILRLVTLYRCQPPGTVAKSILPDFTGADDNIQISNLKYPWPVGQDRQMANRK